eukprot:TRINITY_DN45053_c0_g2_i1.p1 TRINITY_DN45053_c0_g2~~TRINITY_DN45053_c0_g2_i1.p1  ORF type:complete len:154 (-),score=8.99 TRINITY_DN45053_c0_g2_i1:46-507(-)
MRVCSLYLMQRLTKRPFTSGPTSPFEPVRTLMYTHTCQHTSTYSTRLHKHMSTYSTCLHTAHVYIQHTSTYSTRLHTAHVYIQHASTYSTCLHTAHVYIQHTSTYSTRLHTAHTLKGYVMGDVLPMIQKMDRLTEKATTPDRNTISCNTGTHS